MPPWQKPGQTEHCRRLTVACYAWIAKGIQRRRMTTVPMNARWMFRRCAGPATSGADLRSRLPTFDRRFGRFPPLGAPGGCGAVEIVQIHVQKLASLEHQMVR